MCGGYVLRLPSRKRNEMDSSTEHGQHRRPLDGKVALVTGATGKVGQEIVRRLAREGANVAIHYRTHRELAESLVEELTAAGSVSRAYGADFLSTDGPEDLARKVLADFGGVDILVNSASQFPQVRLGQTGADLWYKMFDLHATSAWRLVNALADNFRSRPDSAIVNMVDIWALRPKATFGAYTVSKAALTALTMMWADELAPTTTVNAVAPGTVHIQPDLSPQEQAKIISRIPLGRPGTAQEVADVVMAVCTWRYVTGTVIAVDGGRSLAWD